MIEFLKALFAESPLVSSMRVYSFMAVVMACVLAGVGLLMNRSLEGLSILCGVFLGAAFTGKVLQKSIEMKAKDVNSEHSKHSS